jgi:hypothetical protein
MSVKFEKDTVTTTAQAVATQASGKAMNGYLAVSLHITTLTNRRIG